MPPRELPTRLCHPGAGAGPGPSPVPVPVPVPQAETGTSRPPTANRRRTPWGPHTEIKPDFCLEKEKRARWARSTNPQSVCQPDYRHGPSARPEGRAGTPRQHHSTTPHAAGGHARMRSRSWELAQKEGEGRGKKGRKTPHRADESQNRRANTG